MEPNGIGMLLRNRKGDLEIRTIVVIIILFFTMLLIIIWVSGGFKTLTAGLSSIGNASVAKAMNASSRYPA